MDFLDVLSNIRWRPQIGDPYLLAWVTVVAYLVAAFGCGLCARRAKQIFGSNGVSIHRTVWWFLCVTLLFLGINKQLDIHALFTEVIKLLARHWELYELGKRSQKYFLLGIAVLGVGGLGWMTWKIRHSWRRYIVLILGALVIIRFVLVRIGTFYGVHLPRLSVFTGGFQINWLMELAGVTLIAIAAFLNVAFPASGKPIIRWRRVKRGH